MNKNEDFDFQRTMTLGEMDDYYELLDECFSDNKYKVPQNDVRDKINNLIDSSLTVENAKEITISFDKMREAFSIALENNYYPYFFFDESDTKGKEIEYCGKIWQRFHTRGTKFLKNNGYGNDLDIFYLYVTLNLLGITESMKMTYPTTIFIKNGNDITYC